MEPYISRNLPLEYQIQTASQMNSATQPGTQIPPVVCVASNDDVWAELLAQNLAARGVPTVRCILRNLRVQIASIADGSMVLLDGTWPMIELLSSVDDLNPVLRQPNIYTVMVVDELVGPHPLAAFEADTVISRTPDMRVFVRKLLSLFQSPAADGPIPAL